MVPEREERVKKENRKEAKILMNTTILSDEARQLLGKTDEQTKAFTRFAMESSAQSSAQPRTQPLSSDGTPFDWSGYVPERSSERFNIEFGIKQENRSQYVQILIQARLKAFPECYTGLSQKKAFAKAKKEFDQEQKQRTPEQVAQDAIVLPAVWQDPVRTDGFRDWLAYIPRELKDAAGNAGEAVGHKNMLRYALEYMPKDHPDRAWVQETLKSALATTK